MRVGNKYDIPILFGPGFAVRLTGLQSLQYFFQGLQFNAVLFVTQQMPTTKNMLKKTKENLNSPAMHGGILTCVELF